MIAWWKAKVAEIMPLIPSFRGFLAKADSEGQPGPMKFNRTEADGANLFGSVLNPLPGLGEGNLPGVAIWRSFSHPDSSSPPKLPLPTPSKTKRPPSSRCPTLEMRCPLSEQTEYL